MITDDQNEKLWDLIKGTHAGMLVTHANHMCHARPMGLLQKDFIGTLYFFTSKSSPKIEEIDENPEVCVTFSDNGSMTFVSLNGTARFSRDRSLIEDLWSPMAGAWFTGKDDPDLVVLEIHVDRAEYWDSKANKMVQVYEVVKANLTGTAPDLGENQKFS